MRNEHQEPEENREDEIQFWLRQIQENPDIPDSIKATISEENFLQTLREYILREGSKESQRE